MRAFFGVIGKQLFLSLGQSCREPAGTEKDIFWVDFSLSAMRGCAVCGFSQPRVSLLSRFVWKPVFTSQLSPQLRQLQKLRKLQIQI